MPNPPEQAQHVITNMGNAYNLHLAFTGAAWIEKRRESLRKASSSPRSCKGGETELVLDLLR